MHKVIQSSKYAHPQLGWINVRVVATARSIRAHWEGSVLHITIPQDLPAKSYDSFLEANIERLLDMKPQQNYYIGQVIDGGEVDFCIVEGTIPVRGDAILVNLSTEGLRPGKEFNICLNIPPVLVPEMASPSVQTHINKIMLRMAAKAVTEFVVPFAKKLAQQTGCRPSAWVVKHKKRSLGTCDGKGCITLSPKLIFLPPHLRAFVILHELAHLSEMNHSAAFHRICDAYCGGHEKELDAALKSFPFPTF